MGGIAKRPGVAAERGEGRQGVRAVDTVRWGVIGFTFERRESQCTCVEHKDRPDTTLSDPSGLRLGGWGLDSGVLSGD